MNRSDIFPLSISIQNPSCQKCPREAVCGSSTVDGIPNYWGYKDSIGYITMIRCPDQYCCQRSDYCKGINTCNTRRGGTLCGRCVGNTTESLFSTKCFQMDKCYTLLFGLLYTGYVVMYSIFLATFNDVKREFISRAMNLIKKITNVEKSIKKRKSVDNISGQGKKTDSYSSLVEALLLDFSPGNCPGVTDLGILNDDRKDSDVLTNSNLVEALLLDRSDQHRKPTLNKKISINNKNDHLNIDMEKNETEKNKSDADSGIKFVQIFLYYVQDATLFKIHLPDANEPGKNILVKILQFSPEILTVYYKLSDLCFTRNTTAVTKIILSSMFGPCIILFLSIVYVVQRIISRYSWKTSTIWETLRSKLMQAFLLTVLFSFQKILKGAFSLIQCVDVDNNKVLYVEGDILCYTWWQRALEVYIYFSILPVFITLAICPFWVKEKEMSVEMLILACLLPIPVFFYQIIVAIVKARKSYVQSREVQDRNMHEALHHIMHFLWHVHTPHGSTTSMPNVGFKTTKSTFIFHDGDKISHVQKQTDSVLTSSGRNENCEKEFRCRKLANDKENTSNPMVTKCKLKCLESTKCEKVVTHILLKHYRTLHFFGVSMTWLGVHKLYRMALVACYTYIKEPLPRLSTMTVLVIAMLLATGGFKPYNDDKANKTAIISYIASIFIAIINVSKSWLNTTHYEATSDSVATTTLQYFDLCENILLSWLPVVAIVMWIIYFIGKWFYSKFEKRNRSKHGVK